MNGYSLFFVVIFCGCAVWSLAGLIFPKVLVVAPPERRTRGYAFFLVLSVAASSLETGRFVGVPL